MRIALVIAAPDPPPAASRSLGLIFAVLTPLGLALAFSSSSRTSSPRSTPASWSSTMTGATSPRSSSMTSSGRSPTAGVAEIERADERGRRRAEVEAGVPPRRSSSRPASALRSSVGKRTEIRIARRQVPVVARDREVRREPLRRGGRCGPAHGRDVRRPVVASPIGHDRSGPGQRRRARSDRCRRRRSSTERQASLATFYGAAMAIMFVFFATQYGALALLADRQVGTMSRFLAAPISARLDPPRRLDRRVRPRARGDDGPRRRHDAASGRGLGPAALVAAHPRRGHRGDGDLDRSSRRLLGRRSRPAA